MLSRSMERAFRRDKPYQARPQAKPPEARGAVQPPKTQTAAAARAAKRSAQRRSNCPIDPVMIE